MAKRIIWSKSAVKEKKAILAYWRRHNQSNAYPIKLNQLFKRAIKLISTQPRIGRKTDIENVRIKLVRVYLIFYEEKENSINILTIWDGRRNPENLLVKKI